MKTIARERSRLRRKFVEKISTRDYHRFDQWADWEFARTTIPIWPSILLITAEGRSQMSDWLLGLGLLLTIPWGTFVFAEILRVFGRFGDKQYMLVTRKVLSKEYRY